MKIIELKKEDFDNFTMSHKYTNPWQTSAFGDAYLSMGYGVFYLGVEDGHSIVAASMIIYKYDYLGFKSAYAPRGIIIDYDNATLLEKALSEIKKFMFRQKVMSLTIDPMIVSKYTTKEDVLIEENKYADTIINNLKEFNFEQLGQNFGFEGIMPKFNAVITLPIDSQETFRKISKQARNKLRKAVKYGVEIYKDEALDYEALNNIMIDKYKHKPEYYKAVCESLKDKCEVFYARLNTEKYVSNSKLLYEKEIENNNYLNSIIQFNSYKGKNMRAVLNKKMESDKVLAAYKGHLVDATDLLRDYPEGLNIAATIVVTINNTAYIVEDNYKKAYKLIPSLPLLRWKLIENYSSKGHKIINLGPISGNIKNGENNYKGLNEAKYNFKALSASLIGEFTMITNKAMYSLYLRSSNYEKFDI